MLDIKLVRSNPELVIAGMKKRGLNLDLGPFLALDEERRALLTEVEQLKSQRNTVSKDIGTLKKAGENADSLVAEMSKVGDGIKALDDQIRNLDQNLNDLILGIPNLPAEGLPEGGESCFQVERTWGETPTFDFTPLAHWDIGEGLGILDFERGTKVTGARFTFYRGLGARLERALISLMFWLYDS